MDVPDLTDADPDKIADGVDEQANGKTFRDLEAKQDEELVGIFEGVTSQQLGRGCAVERQGRKLMDFGLTQEQQMIVETVRTFCENRIVPARGLGRAFGEVPRERSPTS